jgi:hypothetical protein
VVNLGLIDRELNTYNLFKKDATSTATVNKKKEKQEARRQKAQARGEKPIK